MVKAKAVVRKDCAGDRPISIGQKQRVTGAQSGWTWLDNPRQDKNKRDDVTAQVAWPRGRFSKQSKSFNMAFPKPLKLATGNGAL